MRALLLCAVLAVPSSAAFWKADETNAVWLVVINETGQHLRDVELDYQTGRFEYQIFSAGLTHGGYARVKSAQALKLSYTDGDGKRHSRDDLPLLQPGLVGGIMRLTLHKDGRVTHETELARPGAVPDVLSASEYWVGLALTAAAALAGLLVLVWLFKLGRRLAGKAREALRDPFGERLAAECALNSVECPVPMYQRKRWRQGVYRGRMLGYDGGTVWLGGVDEATRCVYRRDGKGSWRYQDYHSGDPVPGVPEPEFQRALEALSPAVAGVSVMTDALEATLDRRGDAGTLLDKDLPLLAAMLDSVAAAQAREERRWPDGLQEALGLRRADSPVAPGEWSEGTYEGVRVGFWRNQLWLGTPGGEPLGAFYLDHAGAWQDGDRRRGHQWPESVPRQLKDLSPAAGVVAFFEGALCVFLDRRGTPETLLREDLPRLKRLLAFSRS